MFSRADVEKKKRIESMRDKFQKGQLLGREDFKAAGFNEAGTKNAIVILRNNYGLDVVNICRGKSLIGWILANEIL